MDQTVYSVSQINGLIKNVIDGVPALNGVYIRGELSNYKIYPSGHHYFTLKDAEGSLKCVLFKGSAFALGEPTNYARSYSGLHHGQAHFFPASS